MKKAIKIFVLFFSITISSFTFIQKAAAQPVSFQVFYDDLSPYGSWYESPQYGYVWSPRLSGFTPYSSGGYWVLTDAGWTWVSDYSWGWAPFHYGRWYYDPVYGYVWVPGYEWGPGWVTWRRSDDYYGWAPIGPGISIGVAYSSGYDLPYNYWHFVRCNDFGRRDIHNYYIDRSKNVTIINNTTVINTTKIDNTRKSTFSPGPDRMEVQKKAGRTINPIAIVDEKKPTQQVTQQSIQLYRPVVENNSNAATKSAPAKITPAKDKAGQTNNARLKNNNDAASERKVKQPMQAQAQQPVQQNNQQSNTQPRKPIRDEQAKQAPPQRRENADDQQSGKPRPIPQQPVQRSDNEQQPSPPVKQRPEQQQLERNQPQPQREQRTEQQPIQQQPERNQPQQQRPERPQQNTERPQIREMPRQQQPIRQAPVQRQPHPGNRRG